MTNRITLRVAWWIPGFAIVNHTGRSTGRTYRTPVNVFRDGSRYVFALTYGAHSDWVQNVIAAGGCVIETRRRRIELVDPERFTDPTRRLVPVPARWILRLLAVNDFIAISIATEAPPRGEATPPSSR